MCRVGGVGLVLVMGLCVADAAADAAVAAGVWTDARRPLVSFRLAHGRLPHDPTFQSIITHTSILDSIHSNSTIQREGSKKGGKKSEKARQKSKQKDLEGQSTHTHTQAQACLHHNTRQHCNHTPAHTRIHTHTANMAMFQRANAERHGCSAQSAPFRAKANPFQYDTAALSSSLSLSLSPPALSSSRSAECSPSFVSVIGGSSGGRASAVMIARSASSSPAGEAPWKAHLKRQCVQRVRQQVRPTRITHTHTHTQARPRMHDHIRTARRFRSESDGAQPVDRSRWEGEWSGVRCSDINAGGRQR